MAAKPTYEELEARVKELDRKISRFAVIERILKGDQERFRHLYEHAPLAYQSLDEQGRIIEVNQAWIDLLGYTREEVIGRSMGEFLRKEWKEHFKKNFPRFKALGEILGIEFEIRTKEGFPLLVSVNGKISYDENGNFQQTHCILSDITERDRTDKIRDEMVADLKKQLTKIKNVLSDCKSCSQKLNSTSWDI
jgi:PAS domain S-box-containing protein